MDFPDKLTEDEMKLRLKEWEVSGLRVVQYDRGKGYLLISVGESSPQNTWERYVNYERVVGGWKILDKEGYGDDVP